MLSQQLEKICDNWHEGEQSHIFRLGSFREFDPEGVIRELEGKKKQLMEMEGVPDELKVKFLHELIVLKKYILDISGREVSSSYRDSLDAVRIFKNIRRVQGECG